MFPQRTAHTFSSAHLLKAAARGLARLAGPTHPLAAVGLLGRTAVVHGVLEWHCKLGLPPRLSHNSLAPLTCQLHDVSRLRFTVIMCITWAETRCTSCYLSVVLQNV